MTEAAGGQYEPVSRRVLEARARGEYLPSPTTGKPDLPPRQAPTAFTFLWAIVEGAWTLAVGHWVTFKNFWRRKVTEQYPYRNPERNWKPRPGYRGDFALITDRKTGRLRCTACMQCANICPAGCIWIVAEGRGKDRHPVQFSIDAGLCMYCWLCVETCPFGAITMTPDYETATFKPEHLIRDIEYLRTRGLEYHEPLKPIEAKAQHQEGQAEAGDAR